VTAAAIGSDGMSPVEIAATAACVALLAAAAGAAVALRRLLTRARGLEAAVDRLREQVEELSRRERAASPRPAEEADWLITFDDRQPHTASTQQVVSTTLGEPLLKVAALSHGVRYALREEKRAHLAHQVRREYRRRRRSSRARARAAQGRAARAAAEQGRTAQ
jgi:hypothetical protein